jgi:hypothetical protein
MPSGYVVEYNSQYNAHLVRTDEFRHGRWIDLFVDGNFEGTDVTHENIVGRHVTWDDEHPVMTAAFNVSVNPLD